MAMVTDMEEGASARAPARRKVSQRRDEIGIAPTRSRATNDLSLFFFSWTLSLSLSLSLNPLFFPFLSSTPPLSSLPPGFVEEMRFVAMKLHTKDQAPKEGQREAAPTPWAKWQPTRTGYLKFLNESKKVYEALEEAVASRDEYELFRNTGLERSQALAQDVRWFKEKYGMEPTETGADGPGARYAAELRRLAAEDPPAFVCHFYNVYFAHTAGGRMIGVKMADMLLQRHALEFYKYPLAPGEAATPGSGGGGDHRPLLDAVRQSLDAVAETWTRDQKDRCLAETEESFKMSGALLRSIAEPVEEGEAAGAPAS